MFCSEPKCIRECPIPLGPTPEFYTEEQVRYIAVNLGIPLCDVLNEKTIRKIVIVRSRNPFDRETFYESQSFFDFIDAYKERKRENHRIKARRVRKQSGEGEQPAKPAKLNKGNAKK